MDKEASLAWEVKRRYRRQVSLHTLLILLLSSVLLAEILFILLASVLYWQARDWLAVPAIAVTVWLWFRRHDKLMVARNQLDFAEDDENACKGVDPVARLDRKFQIALARQVEWVEACKWVSGMFLCFSFIALFSSLVITLSGVFKFFWQLDFLLLCLVLVSYKWYMANWERLLCLVG